MSEFNYKRAMLAWEALRKERSTTVETIEKDAEAFLEETKVAKRGKKKGESRPGVGAVPKGAGVKAAGKARSEVLPVLDNDVEKLTALEEGRKATAPAVTRTSEKRLATVKKYIASADPAVVNELLRFGLTPKEAEGIGELLGRRFGQTIEIAGDAETQKALNDVLAGLEKHWAAAAPPGGTERALKKAWDRLPAMRKANPDRTDADLIREILFKPWRERFMRRLADPESREFTRLLESSTGMVIGKTKAGTLRFELHLELGKRSVVMRFDVDHAATDLAEAVSKAKSPKDLLPVVDGKNLQLLTVADNRTQIKLLREEADKYSQAAEEALKTVPKGADAARVRKEVQREIDDMLDVLDKRGVTAIEGGDPVISPTGEDWLRGY